MKEVKHIKGIKVKIFKTSDYPTPFGLEYDAKGFYIQKNNVIIVGTLNPDSTIRIKYPIEDVYIEIF